MTNNNWLAVVILYKPTDKDIKNCEELSQLGIGLYLVVNGCTDVELGEISARDNVFIKFNSTNIGLAGALNQGIEYFLNKTYKFLLLLDQDTVLGQPFFNDMETAYELLSTSNRKIGVLGPTLIDIKAASLRVGAKIRSEIIEGVKVRFPECLATSGTVIDRRSVFEVGPMMAELFIDGIDYEWCNRAKMKGIGVAQLVDVTVNHDMGVKYLRLLGRYRPLYTSPIRHYYISRNFIFLGLYSPLNLTKRVSFLLKAFARMPVYILVSEAPLVTIKNCLNAILHAFSKRLGPFPQKK